MKSDPMSVSSWVDLCTFIKGKSVGVKEKILGTFQLYLKVRSKMGRGCKLCSEWTTLSSGPVIDRLHTGRLSRATD